MRTFFVFDPYNSVIHSLLLLDLYDIIYAVFSINCSSLLPNRLRFIYTFEFFLIQEIFNKSYLVHMI